MNDNSITQTCENCESPLQGRYCHKCGQDSAYRFRYLGDIVMAFLASIFSYDSRVNQTLVPLMLKPGKIVKDYLAGHRVKYISPFRLYLFCNLIFFLLATLFFNYNNDEDGFIEIEEIPKEVITPEENTSTLLEGQSSSKKIISAGDKELAQYITEENKTELQKLKELDNSFSINFNGDGSSAGGSNTGGSSANGLDANQTSTASNFEQTIMHYSALLAGISDEQLEQKFKDQSQWNGEAIFSYFFSLLPKVMLICLPIFALILKVFYIRQKKMYVEHLIFMAYVQSFVFILLTFYMLFTEVSNLNATNQLITVFNFVIDKILLVLTCWMFVYIYLSFKNVYEQGWFITTVKFSMISALFFMIFVLSLALSMWWAFVVT